MQRILVALSLAAGCGSGTPAAFHLQMSNAGTADGEVATLTLQGGETRVVQILVLGSVSAPVTFSGRNLPAFANLDGPLLTISPHRADKGTFDLTLVATAGEQTATGALRVTVTRTNSPPVVMVGFVDNLTHYTNVCPSPSLCTVTGAARVELDACDPEGDGIRFEVEVTSRDHPFSGTATYSTFVSGLDPARKPACCGLSGTCARAEFALAGLTLEESYRFAIRVVDEFGAIASYRYEPASVGADGWATYDRWGFDQGPCTTRRCACLPSGFEPCLASSECCSGVCALDVHGWPTCQPCTAEQHCACLPSGYNPCLADSDCCSGKCVQASWGGTACQ
jgi:hypothetical protein